MMRRLVAWVGCACACGAPSYAVPRHPHPPGAPAQPVELPPPPAQVEHLDAEPPAEGCLWADGQWIWVARRWDWRPGAWVRPAAGCQYSAPTLEWAPGGERGVLYYRPGRWYSVGSLETCPNPVTCPTPSPAPSNAERARGG